MKSDIRVKYNARSFGHLRGLDRISDAQLAEHLGLYAGYVSQVNSLTHQLAEMRQERAAAGNGLGLAEAARRLSFEYDGMVLHEHYFGNLKPGGDTPPSDRQALGQALAEAFGSIERWRDEFQAIGALRGVGWVILFQEPATDQLMNYWVGLHQNGVPVGSRPLLVMDVWEHAFMRDYKAAERSEYVKAFFRNIDWPTVDRRHREATTSTSRTAA
jgi:Fe-Mn family superoxide dismutase